MDIKEALERKKALVDGFLDQYLKNDLDMPGIIYEAMRYSLFAGGKRLRPILAMEGCEVCGGDPIDVVPIACAIEMIHTYSLIHDDLPAMDNDDYRRGKPTCHKVFGEAIAVLAGDALLNSAFEIMLEAVPLKGRDIEAMRLVARSAGARGMIGGQVLDLAYEDRQVGIEALQEMYSKKTGALINASILSGALIAGCDDREYQMLYQYGNRLGLAFQIRDDILDEIGDEKIMGKKAGSDAVNSKSTYITLLGLDGSKGIVKDLACQAKVCLKDFGPRAKFLVQLTDYLVDREY